MSSAASSNDIASDVTHTASEARIALSGILADLLSAPLWLLVFPPLMLGFKMLGGRDSSDWMIVAMAVVVLVVWGSMLNHYADWEADQINRKRTWLHCSLTREQLLHCQWIPLLVLLTIIGFGLNHNWKLQVMLFVGLVGAVQYSFLGRVKDRLWLNYLYLALAYGTWPLLVGLLASGAGIQRVHPPTLLFTSLLLLLLDLGIAPSKDYGDLQGDTQMGKRTLPNSLGESLTIRFQFLATCLALFCAICLMVTMHEPMLWITVGSCALVLLFIQLKKHKAFPNESFLCSMAGMSVAIRMSLVVVFM